MGENEAEQDKETIHCPEVVGDKTTIVREQDQMSSTKNIRQSPNRALHEICSHEGVDILSV